jgi:regulatory protein
MIITKILKDKHRKERYIVTIEGRSPFPVTAEILVKHNLKHGLDIDEDTLAAISSENENKLALEASLNLLSYSQRSSKELAERLKLKKFSPAAINKALDRLNELGYLNDTALAKNLLTLRRLQGKGTELIKFEMKRKGIPANIITDTLADNRITADEEALEILPLAKKKFKQASRDTSEKAVQKLMGFLARRGFSPDTVSRVLKLLKKEASNFEE